MATLFYDLFHIGAALLALGAMVAFIATFVRRSANTTWKRWVRLVSPVVAISALAASLLVTSPLAYHAAAPIAPGATVYTVSWGSDLYAFRATDGSPRFIHHLSGPLGQFLL
jgi:hypothetical protein